MSDQGKIVYMYNFPENMQDEDVKQFISFIYPNYIDLFVFYQGSFRQPKVLVLCRTKKDAKDLIQNIQMNQFNDKIIQAQISRHNNYANAKQDINKKRKAVSSPQFLPTEFGKQIPQTRSVFSQQSFESPPIRSSFANPPDFERDMNQLIYLLKLYHDSVTKS